MIENGAPDWQPAKSAIGVADGTREHGSTGQLFEAKGGRWMRIRFDENTCPGHVASDRDAKVCQICGTHIDSMRPDEIETD
jgi:hypothetical protein